MSDLRTRLGFIVVAIDAGQFRTPQDAVEAILNVMGSCTAEHRDQLNRWNNALPSVR